MTLDERIAAVVRDVLADQLAERAWPAVFNLQGAATYMATSPKVVKALVDAGELPCLRVGGQYRIARVQLDALLARGAAVDLGAVG